MISILLKYSGLALGLLLLLVSSFVSAQEADTASVKIKVDIAGVSVLLNNDTLLIDSYGNRLIVDAWFVLNLEAGDYHFNFQHPDYDNQVRELTLGRGEVATLEIRFLPEEVISARDTVVTERYRIAVLSTPIEAMITLDGTMLSEETPTDIRLSAGAHEIEVQKDGWEPLTHTIQVNNSIVLNYIMMPNAPAGLTPDAVGLEYRQPLPPLDVRQPEQLRAKFNSLAETFAILPLGQGLVAKAFLRGDHEKTANVLIVSGVVLSAASYLLGKVLAKNKLNTITLRNAEIEQINHETDEHNALVDKTIEEHDAELLEKWLAENDSKGKVEVEILTDSSLVSP